MAMTRFTVRVFSSAVGIAGCTVIAGCTAESDDTDVFSSFNGASGGSATTRGGSGSATNPDTSADSGMSADSGPPEDGGLRLDTPSSEGSGAGNEDSIHDMGCKKVDFVFVVDNSVSMNGEQMNLINSFPLFMDTIQLEIEADDYHVMVVDTDAGEDCEEICTTGGYTNCETGSGLVSCSSYGGLDMCDHTLGAGRVRTWDNSSCAIDGGRRYMLETASDLKGAFSCAALAGTGGDNDEKQVGAAIAAVQPTINGPGGCNEGFLRDDALLVIIIITDEDEGPDNTGGTPEIWKQALVDAKLGEEKRVAVLGLLGDGGPGNGGICTPYDGMGAGAYDAWQLRKFTESFHYGSWGSVCAANYDQSFEEIVPVVATACYDFIPPE